MYKLCPTLMTRQRVCFPERVSNMVGHLFQNYDTIYVRFFPTYTCNHSCYTIYVRFFLSRILAFFPALWVQTRIYMRTKKPIYICVTNKHMVYAVTESRRIESTELYRQPKTPSCTIQMKGNFGLNQSWLQWSRSFRARFCSYSLPSQ